MEKKKELTKQPKVYYNGSIPIKHCGRVIGFVIDDKAYFRCRECGRWVEIKIKDYLKA